MKLCQSCRVRSGVKYVPTKLIPVPALQAWSAQRALPAWRGGEFRKWMKQRKR